MSSKSWKSAANPGVRSDAQKSHYTQCKGCHASEYRIRGPQDKPAQPLMAQVRRLGSRKGRDSPKESQGTSEILSSCRHILRRVAYSLNSEPRLPSCLCVLCSSLEIMNSSRSDSSSDSAGYLGVDKCCKLTYCQRSRVCDCVCQGLPFTYLFFTFLRQNTQPHSTVVKYLGSGDLQFWVQILTLPHLLAV